MEAMTAAVVAGGGAPLRNAFLDGCDFRLTWRFHFIERVNGNVECDGLSDVRVLARAHCIRGGPSAIKVTDAPDNVTTKGIKRRAPQD